ncbi:hypothetical protein EYR36_003307 [Pleurotus pulmonarius]|nr:hypothetical protein EYR36_003307 [Pleurotus pulmonarius]
MGTPQKQPETAPDPATSGKKRRRMEADTAAQPSNERAMDEDTPDTPTRPTRPSTRTVSRSGKATTNKRGGTATSSTASAGPSRTTAASAPANTLPAAPPATHAATAFTPAATDAAVTPPPPPPLPAPAESAAQTAMRHAPAAASAQAQNHHAHPTAVPAVPQPAAVAATVPLLVPLPAPQPAAAPAPTAMTPQHAPAHIIPQVAAPPPAVPQPLGHAAPPHLPAPPQDPIAIMAANANAPRIHGISAEDILNNHHVGQRSQWEAFAGPKGLILPFDPGYTIAGAVARVPLLKRAIKAILHLPGEPRVGSPTHAEDTIAPSAPPHFYLLGGVTQAQLNTLTAGQVWSTDIISFFVFPFSPPPTRYIASFTGLSLPCSAEGTLAVEAAFRNEINALDDARSFIANFHDNVPGYTSPLTALHNLTAGLTITARDTPKGVVWNLYMDSPTLLPAAYQQWNCIIADVRVFLLFEGSAIRTDLRHCTRCFSCDHTFRICPFPLLPGWLGPGPIVPRPKVTRGHGPQHGHGAQRGQSSRGRGYNNRGM